MALSVVRMRRPRGRDLRAADPPDNWALETAPSGRPPSTPAGPTQDRDNNAVHSDRRARRRRQVGSSAPGAAAVIGGAQARLVNGNTRRLRRLRLQRTLAADIQARGMKTP